MSSDEAVEAKSKGRLFFLFCVVSFDFCVIFLLWLFLDKPNCSVNSTYVAIKVQRSSSVSPYLHIAPLLITSISIIDRKTIPCPLYKSSQYDKVLRELSMSFLYDQTNSERTRRCVLLSQPTPSSSFSYTYPITYLHHHTIIL